MHSFTPRLSTVMDRYRLYLTFLTVETHLHVIVSKLKIDSLTAACTETMQKHNVYTNAYTNHGFCGFVYSNDQYKSCCSF